MSGNILHNDYFIHNCDNLKLNTYCKTNDELGINGTGYNVQVPKSLYYIEEFITREDEERLSSCVYGCKPDKWENLLNRRLQNWGGIPSVKGMLKEEIPDWLSRYCNILNKGQVFQGFKNGPNHVLVNEYKPGQGILPHEDGPIFSPIIATISLNSHTVIDFYKHRSIIQQELESQSNGNERTSSKSEPEPEFSVYLAPRSLFVVKEECYKSYLHGIRQIDCDDMDSLKLVNKSENMCNNNDDDVNQTDAAAAAATTSLLTQRETRISLTFRHVPKVMTKKMQHFLIGRLSKYK